MTERTKLGIIQSRGLGDIVIALPVARAYWEDGHDIYWPICEPFVASFRESVPWITWLPVPVDPQGRFFLETPLSLLADQGITSEDDMLYLYQYLSSVPEKTDPDLFAMMKFDQYKYAITGVPFSKKWELSECITRNVEREQKLYDQVVTSDRYMVYQGTASDVAYEIDLSSIDPAVEKIEITELTDSIFDWLKVLEGAETIILIDSVFANLIDQLKICGSADLYFMRKWNRKVDGNPVLLGDWSYIHVEAPAGVQVQSIAEVAGAVAKDPAVNRVQASNQQTQGQGSAQTYTPFGQTQGGVPTSFLGATKQGQQQAEQTRKPNSAQSLLAGLGLRQ
jgi:hypothetical protein